MTSRSDEKKKQAAAQQLWWDRERAAAHGRAYDDDAADVDRSRLLRSDLRAYAARYGLGGVVVVTSSLGATIAKLPLRTFTDHVNHAYVVDVAGERVLFDVGSGLGSSRQDLLDGLVCLDKGFGLAGDVDVVVVSHAHIDHFGDVGFWKNEKKVPIWVHEIDARVLEHFAERTALASQEMVAWLQRAGVDDVDRAAMRAMHLNSKDSYVAVVVDKRLRHRQQLFGGRARVIHTPGHCPGHICLRVDDVLLVADQVLSPISPHITPQALHPHNGLERYLFGLSRLLDEKGVNKVLSAHYDDVDDLAGRIVAIVEGHKEKLQKTLAVCADNAGARVVDVARAVYGERKGVHVLLAVLEAGTHVEYLHQMGLLRLANLDDVSKDPRCPPRYVAVVDGAASNDAMELALGR